MKLSEVKTTTTIADAKARARALDPSHSFIVQAPAGSGKTELLTQRFLNLLAYVNAPEEIIAITFTKKAANEMRARIIDALLRASQTAMPEEPHKRNTWQLAQNALERDQKQQWHLLENPTRLRILTIDAFCYSLTSQMPITAKFGTTTTITDDAAPLYEQAASELLASLEENVGWQEAIKTLLIHLDNHLPRVKKLIVNMLAKRDQWLPHILGARVREELESHLQHINQVILEKCDAHIPEVLKNEIANLARYAADNINHTDSAIIHCKDMIDMPLPNTQNKALWLAISELLLTKSGSFRKSVTIKIGFPAPSSTKDKAEKLRFTEYKNRFSNLIASLEENAFLLPSLIELTLAPPEHYTDEQWHVLNALMTLLPIAAAKLRIIFSQRGCIDYIENMLAANLALGDDTSPTDLALGLDYKIKHILVDEFQDTSVHQTQLLAKLTAGWTPDDQHSLFIVGDPMQSIYRFRQAEVGLFLRAKHFGIGHIPLESLMLKTNFRSANKIVEWNNTHFSDIFPKAEDMIVGAITYAPSIAHHEDNATIECHGVLNNNESSKVIAIIDNAKQENPEQTIAILVRSRSHLFEIIQGLKERKLDYQAIEIEQLSHRPVIQDLMALTKALLHLYDRVAWLSVFRAPWCGLTLSDLYALPQEFSIFDPEIQNRLSDDGKKRLSHCQSILVNALEQRQQHSLREWIESTWKTLGGAHYLKQTSDIEDAQHFFALTETLDEQASVLDFDTLDKKINELFASPSTSSPNPIQIMTIHKSKGLEFDTVIIPGLNKRPRPTSHQLLLWLEHPDEDEINHLLLAPISQPNTRETIYDFISKKEKEKYHHELTRLLYVAATRAKSQLHFVASLSIDDEGCIQHPTPNSLLSLLWESCQQDFLRDATPSKDEETTTISAKLKRFPINYFTQHYQPIEKSLGKNQPELSLYNDVHALTGTLIHLLLQHIAEQGKPIAYNPSTIEQMAKQIGVLPHQCDEVVQKTQQALDNISKDPKGKWILSPHKEHRAELSMTIQQKNKLQTVVVDRTFVDENDERWIIDYKTSVYHGDELESYLQSEAKKHHPQLDLYRQAFQSIEDRKTHIALYFPLIPAWYEW